MKNAPMKKKDAMSDELMTLNKSRKPTYRQDARYCPVR
jgi:hypothetical protein